MTMAETIARAIYDATDPTRDDPIGVTLHNSEFVEAETLPEQLEQVMSICRAAALAALKAMREPTEAMTEAASARHRWGFGQADARLAWEDMVDAAILEAHVASNLSEETC